MKEIGIYIHIPFCLKKCLYCDFVSFDNMETYYDSYINELVNEIKNNEILKDNLKDYSIKSIYVGGGTPTILDIRHIYCIINELHKYNINTQCEISIEANPKTVDYHKLKELYKMKINRLSFGLQSTNAKLLAGIGRIHNYSDFYKNYIDARNIGFKNINIDLMFSLPNQTADLWKDTLYKVMDLKPEHISAYSLIIEESTHFGKLFKEGLLTPTDDDEDRKMYHDLKKILDESQYLHYEISNFAKEGYECIHNLIYWERGEYLGFGLNAHSFANNRRFCNTSDLSEYLSKADKVIENNRITTQEAIEETIFLGMRLLKGLDVIKFENVFGFNIFSNFEQINNLIKEGFLIFDGQFLRLSDIGIDVSNMVFSKILIGVF